MWGKKKKKHLVTLKYAETIHNKKLTVLSIWKNKLNVHFNWIYRNNSQPGLVFFLFDFKAKISTQKSLSNAKKSTKN